MDYFENFVEYYDELFPISESKKKFYESLQADSFSPIRSLHLGSGTGILEHHLAQRGFDITGIEISQPLIDSACLKRRTQLMALRFFKLSTLDIGNVLGKNFFNVISTLNDRIIFLRKKEYLENLFSQCKELLTNNGIFIIETFNYEKILNTNISEITRESIRTKFKTKIRKNNEEIFISQIIETPNGKSNVISNEINVHIPTIKEIEELSKKYNYSKIEFFEDFEGTPFTKDSEALICILHA